MLYSSLPAGYVLPTMRKSHRRLQHALGRIGYERQIRENGSQERGSGQSILRPEALGVSHKIVCRQEDGFFCTRSLEADWLLGTPR